MNRLTFRAFAVPVVAGVITLAACGGGGSQPSSSGSSSKPPPQVSGVGASKLIAAAPDKTAAVKTAKMSGALTIDTGGKTQTIPLEGALDLEHQALQFSFDLGALGLRGGSGGGKVEARLVDGVMYMNLGALAGAGTDNPFATQLAGKTWVKLDLQSFASSLGADTSGGLGNLSDANPSGTLDTLRGADDVERVGTDDVRGTETTHYRITIDPAKALDQAPAELRQRLQSALDMFGGPTPADVWIDGDGLLRKMSLEISTPQGRVSEEFELYDLGAPVTVTAPPADEVVDFGELFGQLIDGFSQLGSSQSA